MTAFLLMVALALTACKGGKTEKEAEAAADEEEEMMDPDDDSFFGNYRNYFKTEEPKEVTVKTAKSLSRPSRATATSSSRIPRPWSSQKPSMSW